MKLKLYRDKVISRVKGKDLVGVYVKVDKHTIAVNAIKLPEAEILLAEMSPIKADIIIKLWNAN